MASGFSSLASLPCSNPGPVPGVQIVGKGMKSRETAQY